MMSSTGRHGLLMTRRSHRIIVATQFSQLTPLFSLSPCPSGGRATTISFPSRSPWIPRLLPLGFRFAHGNHKSPGNESLDGSRNTDDDIDYDDLDEERPWTQDPVKIFTYAFIGVNAMVWVYWQHAWADEIKKRRAISEEKQHPTEIKSIALKEREFLSDKLEFMMRNFATSRENLENGRWYSLFLGAISQMDFAHLAFNMITLYAFAGIASANFVPVPTLAVLFAGSTFTGASAGLWYHENFLGANKSKPYTAMGASTFVMGMMTSMACLSPHAKLQLLYFIPVKMWQLAAGVMGIDVCFLKSDQTISHSAHLGGSLFGLVLYALHIRQRKGLYIRREMLRRFPDHVYRTTAGKAPGNPPATSPFSSRPSPPAPRHSPPQQAPMSGPSAQQTAMKRLQAQYPPSAPRRLGGFKKRSKDGNKR